MLGLGETKPRGEEVGLSGCGTLEESIESHSEILTFHAFKPGFFRDNI
jgi:hypothetical protein